MSHETGQTFVFFGIMGSGKGTQIELLTGLLNEKDGREVVYAGTGEGFRQLMNSNSYTATLVKDYMNRGELVPDFLTNAIFTNVLIASLSPEKNLITDGYPRTVSQSESFEKKMDFYKRHDIKIIYIEVNKDEALRRNLLRGRYDDTTAGLEKRFEEYVNKVIPAMNYFNDKTGYKIFTINGEQSVENVHKDIIKALGY